MHTALLALIAALAMQQQPDPGAETVERVAALSWLVGEWAGVGELRPGPDAPPIVQRARWVNDIVWGGANLRMTFEAEYGEGESAGAYAFTCFVTWNPVDDRYESIWISHDGHIRFIEKGQFDPETGALTLIAVKQFHDAMTPQTARSVFTREGDDRFSVIDHVLNEASGEWWETFSFHCVRE